MDKPDDSILTKMDAAFSQLSGDSIEPYPWQRALFKRIVEGDWPQALDIPTGLGKTSIISIWLLAHVLGDRETRPPMRLVYVVNRRTIVDQATNVAVALADRVGRLESWRGHFGEEPPAVSTLRGALADNRRWLDNPSRPAVIIGTVDMIGSRLLFSGYRTGRWQLARHAGLVGHDSLIVHDEAHLSRPFQKLLEWIETRQGHTPGGIRILPMSATGQVEGNKNLVRINDEDCNLPTVKKRIEARKYLRLYRLAQKNDLVTRLADLALKHDGEKCRVIVFVTAPKDAVAVYDSLLKKNNGDPSCVELLSGTIRGYERDKLVESPVLVHLLNGAPPNRTEYLVSTSAGEVGADFDADHLVCDLSTLDAMIQRFGRVNRRGGDNRVALIDVVVNLAENQREEGKKKKEEKKEKPRTPFEAARAACAAFLEKLEKMTSEGRDGIDASPKATCAWREMAEYVSACAPEIPTVNPHDVVLDAWSLTSIQEDWPLCHDVHPYLHGLEDEEPETFVAWRAELDHLDLISDEDIDWSERLKPVFDSYPLRTQELLRDKPKIVAHLVWQAAKCTPNKIIAVLRNRHVVAMTLGEFVGEGDLKRIIKNIETKIQYATVILPSVVGGLRKGMIDQASSTVVRDVADESGTKRARVLLSRTSDGWSANQLPCGECESPAERPCFEKWTEARDTLQGELGMKYIKRVVLSKDEERQPTNLLLLFAEPQNRRQQGHSTQIDISEHNTLVRTSVASYITNLNLPISSAPALHFAADHHDDGKSWEWAAGRWQRAIKNPDPTVSLAKSTGKEFDPTVLDGYRHEFGSLLSTLRTPEFHLLDETVQDLVLHLIATHHGRGRPHFDDRAMKVALDLLPNKATPGEVARRFSRLQHQYGYWGLAWLEAIFMAADAEGSQKAGTDDAEDEDQEGEDQ